MNWILYNIPLPVKGFIAALFICFILMPFIIKAIKSLSWLDKPNDRKVHRKAIPTMGGMGIFLSMIFVILIRPSLFSSDIMFVLVGATIMFITGILDDLNDIKPRNKLYIQLITALLMVLYGIRIENLQVLGIGNISMFLSIFLSVICIVFFINAFNLIDGIDGLAGGLSIITLSFFSFLFYFAGAYDFALLSAALAGSSFAFLFFNFNPARIFMGNTGSLTIGFIISIIAIRALQLPPAIYVDTFRVDSFSVVFALVLLPSLDAVRVIITRMLKGFSPFRPDKTHIHHIMLDAGLTHKTASVALYCTQIIILLLAVFTPPLIVLEIILGISILTIPAYELFNKIKLFRQKPRIKDFSKNLPEFPD